MDMLGVRVKKMKLTNFIKQLNNISKLFIFLIVAALSTKSAKADNDPNYILQAKLSLDAFQCSIYSLVLENEEESKRLFQLGYSNGISFLEFAEKNNIPTKNVPVYFLINSGPTNDFKLGRIYQQITRWESEKIDSQIDIFDPNYKNLAQKKANRIYTEKKCPLLK